MMLPSLKDIAHSQFACSVRNRVRPRTWTVRSGCGARWECSGRRSFQRPMCARCNGVRDAHHIP